MFFLLVFISACSLDTKSGIWNEKKSNKSEINFKFGGTKSRLNF